ncbi:MAG: LysR family transcriptional regulator [Alphaproteobacteria bacterium]
MSRLPITGLETFLAIAECGSLRRAAAALGVQPPAVSQHLRNLEDRLGVAVFTRTTRSVRLTDAGRVLLARIQPAFLELRSGLDETSVMGRQKKGTVRVTLPYIAYQIAIADRLAEFRETYPEIELELSFNEAFVDIVAEGFHAGVRMGDHIQEDMIAVRLTPALTEVHIASPSYFARRGRPAEPAELLGHDCIRYRYIGSGRIAEWSFRGAEGAMTVAVKGSLIVNSTSAVIDSARDGLGIGWLFRPNVVDDLRSGTLESVLDKFAIERPGFFLYFPGALRRLEVLRAFVDFMRMRKS